MSMTEIPGMGDNSIQALNVNTMGVTSMDITLTGSGAMIGSLSFS